MGPAALSVENSIKFWMKDIRWTPEIEHVTLQAKAIPGGVRGPNGRSPSLNIPSDSSIPLPPKKTSTLETSGKPERFDYISAYMERSVHLVNDILKRCEKQKSMHMETSRGVASETSQNLSVELANQIIKMCCDFENPLRFSKENFDAISALFDAKKTQASLRQQATLLSALARRTININGRQNSIILSISRLHRLFMEQIVLVDCQILSQKLRTSKDSTTFIKTANIICTFANHGNHIRRLFCQTGVITSLLSPNYAFDINESTQVATLRCLANVSCHPDSILKFNEDGNFQKLIALLWINGNSDVVRCETAGVLAQVAAHLLPNKQSSDASTAAAVVLLDGLINALPPVLRALIHVSKNAKDEVKRNLNELTSTTVKNVELPETLLVVAACIANLSFLYSATPVLELLCQQDCMSSLLRAWRNGYAKSLFTKDQIIGTVISLSSRQFGQNSLLKLTSLPEFFIEALKQCLQGNVLDPSEQIVRNRVIRRSLVVLECLLKQQEFRNVFLRSQGIAVYQGALRSAKGGISSTILKGDYRSTGIES